MKKVVSLILSLMLLLSLCTIPAFATTGYNSDVTVSAALDKTELTTSSSAQTVVLTIKTSKSVDLFSIGYKVGVPSGWSITKIESGSSNIVYSLDDGHYSLETGVVSWYKATNKSTGADGTIGKITISVPANAAVGTYPINATGIELATSDQNNDNAWMSNGTASAQLTIKAPKTLTDISVKTAPSKTSYVAGQNFDSTGMVIEKKYNDNSTATATNWTVTDGNNLTAGKTSVTISYTEGGVTKTTTQGITVVAKAVSSISVETAPTKTSYVAGQDFDATGMKLKVTYNDGTTQSVTNGWTVTSGTNLAVGQSSVTISYGGKTTTQNITVSAPVSVTGVSLNKTSTTLTVGGSETLIATVAPANATNKAVTWSSSDPTVATVDANGKVTAKKVGTATITVTTTDGNKTATCAVTVAAGNNHHGGNNDTVSSPKTMDMGNMALYAATTILSGCSIAYWGVARKKKQ